MLKHQARKFWNTSILVMLAGAMPACTFQDEMTRQTIHYNIAVEEAYNRTLLVNVVRSKDRIGRVYTELQKITGQNSLKSALGFTLPLTSDGYIANPRVEHTVTPTYEWAVLDSPDFTKGVSRSVGPEVLKEYLERGWPQEFLLLLLIEKIEIEEGGVRSVYTNDPEEPACFLAFQDYVRAMVDRGPRVVMETYGEAVSEAVLPKDLNKLEKASKIWGDKAKLMTQGDVRAQGIKELANPTKDLEIPPGRMQYVKVSSKTKLNFSRGSRETESTKEFNNCEAVSTNIFDPKAPQDSDVVQLNLLKIQENAKESHEKSAPSNTKEVVAGFEFQSELDSRDGTRAVIHLRSPNDIVFYLGEIAKAIEGRFKFLPKLRVRNKGYSGPRTATDKFLEPLFNIEQRPTEGSAIVSANYRGVEYFIPDGVDPTTRIPKAGRSMQAFDLITQLINRQKSAKDLKVTPSVLAIGTN